MRRFAPDWLPGMMAKLGMEEDMPIESRLGHARRSRTPQTKVEGHNFDIRKHVVEYDDVMNMHRDVIYTERDKILEGADLQRQHPRAWCEEELDELIVDAHLPATAAKKRGTSRRCSRRCSAIVPLPRRVHAGRAGAACGRRRSRRCCSTRPKTPTTTARRRSAPRTCACSSACSCSRPSTALWVEHLTAMDEMRQGIGLQAYGQQDPLVAYKREAHDMWDQLLGEHPPHRSSRAIYHVGLSTAPPARPAPVAENASDAPRMAQRPRTAAPAQPASPEPAREPPRPGRRPGARRSTAARSAATTPAPAAPARSTSAATAWQRSASALVLS